MDNAIKLVAMQANLSALRATLAIALGLATEAESAMQRGNANEAIGAADGIAGLVADAAAFHTAALALHRQAGNG